MLTDLKDDTLSEVTYLVGNESTLRHMPYVPTKMPFDDVVLCFLNDLSQYLMHSSRAKTYSDIITFAFWIRKASQLKLRERFLKDDGMTGMTRLGRGVVFHIAPSNVPVIFGYSMVSGLLCGNANIVRMPTKDFDQVEILVKAICSVLEQHPDIKSYICLVQYGHDKKVNDLFSSIADMRVIWGGDQTIKEIRRSPLPPRSGEITFADRYSFAVIDSDTYLALEDKWNIAEGFYNDTYFSDQNACSSPRLIIWTGKRKEEAKLIFWEHEHDVVKRKYIFLDIQGVDKLVKSCLVAVKKPIVQILPHADNMIVRVKVSDLNEIIELRENSGFFYEYDCDDLMELKSLCSDNRCQTISYIGDKDAFLPLIRSGIKGIDRIVPIGKTMDFDLIWDGYNLISMMTRFITIE